MPKKNEYQNRINYDICFPALVDFLTYMNAVKGLANSTIHAYYTDILMLFRYLKAGSETLAPDFELDSVDVTDVDDAFIRKIKSEDIHKFLSYTSIKRTNNTTTRARKASSYRMFFKYLHLNKHIITEEPTASLDIPKKANTLPKFLREEECVVLLDSIDGNDKERDYCIICILLNLGIRVSELVGINLDDFQDGSQIIIRGKGNKERLLYLNDAITDAVSEYQKVKAASFGERKYDKKALLLGRSGKRLTARRVEQIVQQRMNEAGFGSRGISPHKLRHSYATRIYSNGTDIRLLKDILGHSSLSTTQIYTHTSSEAMKKAMTENSLGKKKK